MTRTEKLKKIIGYFGYDHQCGKLLEETKEFLKSFEAKNTLEELADMFNVQCQLELLRFNRTSVTFSQFQLMCDVYKCDFVQMIEVANAKLDRTIQRIDEGYYEI